MDGDGTCASCSPWRRRLGGLKHVRVVAGWLAGWGRHHDRASKSALLDEQLSRGSEC
jgi:hypothetical protein